MKAIFTLLILSLLLASCVQLSYIGSTYTATKNVEVFVDASAIKRPYTIMGKSFVDNVSTAWLTLEKMQIKAVAIAEKKGADAILIEDEYRRYEGSTVRTTTASGNEAKGTVTTTTGVISPNVSHQQTILYLKFQ